MDKHNRWVLLEHIGDPDDLVGLHFDLLLEDGSSCRSWRLPEIPLIDGPPQKVILLPSHSLAWLETETIGKAVSGDRGWAKPVKAGFFRGQLPVGPNDPLQVELCGNQLVASLAIHRNYCRLLSIAGKAR